MTLFGDLQHHAIADLLKVLKAQHGTLYFHQAYQGRTLELTLTSGSLRALYIDGFPVRDESEARTILRQLPARGAFEFQKQAAATTDPGFYAVNLQSLLPGPAQAVPAEQLPHPDTRFQASGAGQPAPAGLQGDWQQVCLHLQEGRSAAELAQLTGQGVPDLQLTLYHLRAAGLITPYRAAPRAPAMVPGEPAAPPAPVSAPLVQRLLGALRRLGRRA